MHETHINYAERPFVSQSVCLQHSPHRQQEAEISPFFLHAWNSCVKEALWIPD